MKVILIIFAILFAVFGLYKYFDNYSWSESFKKASVKKCVMLRKGDGYSAISKFENIEQLCGCIVDVSSKFLTKSDWKYFVRVEFEGGDISDAAEIRMSKALPEVLDKCMLKDKVKIIKK